MKWRYDIKQDGIPSEFHGDPIIVDSLVVIASDGRGTGHLYAFVRETGELRWKHPVSRGIPTDLAFEGDRLYAVTYHDSLLCLELQSGQLRWSLPGEALSRNRFSTHAPVVTGERVLFANSHRRLQAVHAETGEILWMRNFDARISSELLSFHDRIYFGTADQTIFCLDQSNGEVVHRLSAISIPVATPVVAGDRVIFFLNPAGYRGGASVVAAFDLGLQAGAWRSEAAIEWTSSRPYVHNENVLVGDEAGEVFALRASDGAIQWSHVFGGVIRGIGTADPTIYVGTLKGMVYAWAP